MKSFRDLMEDIESVVGGTRVPSVSNLGWDSVDLNEAITDRWTPGAGVAFVATIIEGLVADGMTEEKAIETATQWVAEAYKWSYGIQPDEKDVSDLAGTIDEPPNADVKRGARIASSGLTPSAQEWNRVILNTLTKNPPKPILEFPLEIAVETWNDAIGKALSKGIGVKWEVDKKTGIGYPMPDYSTVYGIWKAMIERMVGLRPSREGEIKLKHALDQAAVDAAKDLRKGVEKLGGKRSAQASAILRGRQGEMNPNKGA